MLRRDYHNETVGILICGTKKRPQRSLQPRPLHVSHGDSRIHLHDKLPEAEQQALPNEGHLVAALEWAEPGREAEKSNYRLHDECR
jgi:hypothetical protein